MDLRVEYLNLNLTGTAGHEHRIEPITRRALSMLADRLPMQLIPEMDAKGLTVEPIDLRLAAMSDEQAANRIADAILQALTLNLNV